MIRALVGAALSFLAACAPAPAGRQAPDVTDAPSIFDLDVPLVDQDGAALRLADLAGHPLVMTMIYTNCTSVCPRITQDMTALERALGPRAADVRFVLVSLDPGRDTPQALRRFAGDHHLNPARWRLLAAPEDGVRDLAAVLGVKYAQAPGGGISHSALVVIVDAHGVVRRRLTGVGLDPKPLLEAIDAL